MVDMTQLKAIIAPVAQKYGAKRLYLFGSYARGEQRENSDIDLRLEMGRTLGLFDLSGFTMDLEKALGRKVDLLTTGGLSLNFLQSIAKDEVLLYDNQYDGIKRKY